MKLNFQVPRLETPTQPGRDCKEAKALHKWLVKMQSVFTRAVDNAGLGFGDGTYIDNIAGTWISYTTNAVANTEDTITHNLNVIPVGYLVFSIDAAGVVYKSTTAWTATQIFLKCSVASAHVLIFVVSPSNH